MAEALPLIQSAIVKTVPDVPLQGTAGARLRWDSGRASASNGTYPAPCARPAPAACPTINRWNLPGWRRL